MVLAGCLRWEEEQEEWGVAQWVKGKRQESELLLLRTSDHTSYAN